MPFYEYRCGECREVFGIERSMSESSDSAACAQCGSADVHRVWNAFIRSGGITPDVGQGAQTKSKTKSGGGCGSCSSHACGTCH